MYAVVFADIQRVIRTYEYDADRFRRLLDSRCSSNADKKIVALTADYEQKTSRIAEIDKVLNKLYEDSALGKIPESRFEKMQQTYDAEQDALRKELPTLKAEIDRLKEQSDAADRFINVIRKYTYLNDLTAEVLNSLLDRIVVHHKEVSADGKEYQQIEIYYRFIGRLDATEKAKKIA